MFIRAPKLWQPRRCRENVNTVDLFPTLCEAAGVASPDDVDGRSLVPLLQGMPAGWSNETFSQYDADEFMLKRGNLKYLTFGDKGPDVLFDLSSDPGESTNRIADFGYGEPAEEMRERLQAFISSRRS
jgi:arylsulfatase A-like enzyme